MSKFRAVAGYSLDRVRPIIRIQSKNIPVGQNHIVKLAVVIPKERGNWDLASVRVHGWCTSTPQCSYGGSGSS